MEIHTPNNIDNTDGEIEPRIYVASLADYNHGRLHGAWIQAATDPDQIHDDITTMLSESRLPDAEEWAIHDHEGFTPWSPSEHELISTVAKIAMGIVEHGPAFAHFAAEVGTIDDVLDHFDNVYCGHWPSLRAYAQDLLADLIDPDSLGPDWLRPYLSIDYDAYARDMSADLHVSEARDGGVYLFQPE
ncbi:MAG: antirestriction protein ArdA [Acidimicrobiales bacterium]|nr:MAG: antirestriction protein ArdA [Acidimicrobiales bacterium]